MGTRQMTPFLSTFYALFRTFISEFKNTQNSFPCGAPFGPFWSVKYIFWPKATNLDGSSYFSTEEAPS